jgi:hypothetical protein
MKKLNEPSIIVGLFEKLTSSNFDMFPIKGKINFSDRHGVYISGGCRCLSLLGGGSGEGGEGWW